MKRLHFFLFFLFIVYGFSYSQINRYGVPQIRNFDPEEIGSVENWAVVQDQRGVIYIATHSSGVLAFDGDSWTKIMVPNDREVRSLMVDDDGLIYVGAKGEFGYLAPDVNGSLYYISILSSLDSLSDDIKTIWKIYKEGEKIYFCSSTDIYAYMPALGETKIYRLIDSGFKFGNYAFKVHEKIYYGDFIEGLLEFYNGSFKKVPGGSFFGNKAILGMLPYGESQILVLTYDSGSFLYDLETGKAKAGGLSVDANKFIIDNLFYTGIQLPGGNYALGTLGGGLLITDNKGEIINIVDNKAGLLNNIITALFINDKCPGVSQLWLALNNGVSKLEVNTPVRIFSREAGIESAVNDISFFNGKYYFATNSGVYYQTTDEKGLAVFKQIPGLHHQSWKFLGIDKEDSRGEMLLVGTVQGLFQLDKNHRLSLMEKEIKNLSSDEFIYNVYDLYSDDPAELILGGRESVFLLRKENMQWKQVYELEVGDAVRSIIKDSQSCIWVGTEINGVFRIDISDPDTVLTRSYGPEEGLPTLNNNKLYIINSELYAATEKGLYKYSEEGDNFIPDNLLGEKYSHGVEITFIETDDNGDIWLSTKKAGDDNYEVVLLKKTDDEYMEETVPFRRLPESMVYVIYAYGDGPVWFGFSDRIFTYNPLFSRDYDEEFHTLIHDVLIGEDSLLFGGVYFSESEEGRIKINSEQDQAKQVNIKYRYNNISFSWGSPYFDGEDNLEFSFRMTGFNNNWSRWSERTEFIYTNLPNKSFSFEVKARNIYGVESTVASYSFTILPPWYKTIIAYLLYLIIAFSLVVIIVKLYTRRLQQEKIRLEGIVARRTAEVVRQKEELEDSITYASRIQRAILPSEKVLNEQLPEHFILFKPRDIVSGDFYWMTMKGDQILIVAADCTGHGVPGAFMSLLGISFLNEIVSKMDTLQSDQVLNMLRQEIMNSLKQTGKDDEAKDGMDLAMCVIDKKKMKIQFSGAYNPLWMVRDLSREEFTEIGKGNEPATLPPRSLNDKQKVLIPFPGDKMPIGISIKSTQPFTNNEIDIVKGSSLYIFSDGYVDQFGGPQGKKFMSRAFKKLILEIQDKTMKEQGRILNEKFEEWKGELDQVDDILVIGIKID